MTVFAIAMVNTEGEIFHFYHPASILDPEGDCKVGQTDATRIHITEELADEGLWIRTHYWKDGAWKTREDADTLYNTWKNESWVFDSAKFMEELRRLRNNKLYRSDWTQLDDCKLSMSKKGEWTEYRQALRDVPANNSSVTNMDKVSWPTEPS